MSTTLANCPYCDSNQKIFHISYNLKKFLNKFEKAEIFILGTYNKKQEIIKKFNCSNCSETLFIYYDIEKLQYFVKGERIEELRNAITDKKKGIEILKKKLLENNNEQIIIGLIILILVIIIYKFFFATVRLSQCDYATKELKPLGRNESQYWNFTIDKKKKLIIEDLDSLMRHIQN